MTATATPRPARRGSVKVLAVVAVFVLLGELVARVLGPHLPPTSLGDAAEMQLKLVRMDQLAKGPRTDLVILGDSMGDRGIDPAMMTRTRPSLGSVYNAALVGAPLAGEAQWAHNFVLGRLRPHTVVLAMSPVDILSIDPIATLTGVKSGTTNIASIDAQFTATLDRLQPNTFSRIDQRLSDVSALVKWRSSLRDPDDLFQAASDYVHGRPPPQGLAAVGDENGELVPRNAAYWGKSLTPQGYARELALQVIAKAPDAQVRAAINTVFDTTELQSSAFGQLLTTVTGHGRKVIVVLLPAANPWLEGNDISISGLRRAAADITTQARAAGASVINLSGLDYPALDYTDVVHLNANGAARFSAQLARTLP